MVHILAARRTCQYAAGQGFHSQRPYSIMGLSSRTVFFSPPPHYIHFTLCPSSCRKPVLLDFCLQLSPEVVICSPSHTTHYSHIVQSCYPSPDHRLTLVFRRVLFSHDHCGLYRQSLAPSHRTYICISSSAYYVTSYPLPISWLIGLSFTNFLVHCKKRVCRLCIIHQYTRS
jgi:hypothetical protein